MNPAVPPALVAGLLPIVCAGVAKWVKWQAKAYDTHAHRAWPGC